MKAWRTSVERGTSVPHVQATGTDNVQDKVSDWEFPMILNCESEFSRTRRVPVEYVFENLCMRVETESDLLFGPGPTMIYMTVPRFGPVPSAQVIRGFTNEGPIYLQHIVAPYSNNRRPGLVKRDELHAEMYLFCTSSVLL